MKGIPAVRWFRILPAVFLMYTISFMDRNNIGFGFSGMEHDLGIGATYAGLAAGIFFIGYLFLQIPGGLMAEKWSAKKIITFSLVFWGIFATLTAFVTNLTELLIIRFFIGLAEGSVAPATVMLLSKWFPQSERARANSCWMVSVPFASMVMSPICGYILSVSDWRTMFLIEGIIPFIWAIAFWFLVEDSPSQAKWLSEREREYILGSLRDDETGMKKQATNFRDALRNRNVILLVAVWFLLQLGFNGFGMWLPTVVKSVTGGNNMSVGIISALPWLAAIIGVFINSRHSDKTGERKWHIAIPVTLGSIFLLVSTVLGQSSPVLSIIFIILCGGCIQSFNGIWWSIPATFLSNAVLGVTLGLINAIGNLGGFFGPFIFGFLKSQTNSFMTGMIFLIIAQLVAVVLLLMVRYERPVTNKNSKMTLNEQLSITK
jgi:sugar phosphate permease